MGAQTQRAARHCTPGGLSRRIYAGSYPQQPMAVNPDDKAIKAKFGKLFTYSQTLLNKMLATRQVHDAKWNSMHQ
jgi:hypothetical protein